ncbi:hypothetical protein H2200_001437 [Cladophialophora chaetospira]|uniref:Uncharacterized protein n=1 Tax=Cladophialophora chaetospira TaxID=386627 RepID=A0AA38XKW3_9EURO|nr:hypothetical protein H2200_001437 [Cladophialophora chaetospira]
MASRRESVVSTRSTTGRKYSTDRYQRQARLSIALEEGRSLRPPLVKEDEVTTSFLKDVFSKPQSTTLSQADTFPCPLEIHPGKRVRGFSTAVEDITEQESVEFKIPFPEPNEGQQQDIQQRGAIFRRANTDINAEEAQLRIGRSASQARERANRPFDRLKSLLGIRPTVKPGAFSGLEYTARLAATHATAILSQKSTVVYKRRSLYVLEYDVDDQGVLLCAPPKLCDSVASLSKYLEEDNQPASHLRLIYVCNHQEAINYLSNAFSISDSSTETGDRSFREWMQDDRETRRASHKAIRWRPAFDIARGVLCTAFGLDFSSLVASTEESTTKERSRSKSQASLYRQRIAVYMQRRSSVALPGPRITRFNSGSRHLHEMAKRDTIIVCEYSSGGETGEIVSANTLLSLNPGHLPTAARKDDTTSSAGLASPERRPSALTPTLQAVLAHIFDGLYQLWHEKIAQIHEPHALLEDHIYAHPSDSSRAREVWAMSQKLHSMLKLVNRHSKVIEAVQDDFLVFVEGDQRDQANQDDANEHWLAHLLDDFQVLAENIGTDYLEPLENMIDLLPLTFLVGAFGMNVDALKDDPSIKWYFVAAVPLMIVVFLFWFAVRRFAPGRNADLMDAAVLGRGLSQRSL